LGTFLPLTLGLVSAVGLDLGTTLLFTGLYNIYSGAFARVPMCVQPMKTIAAVAIAAGGAVTLPQVMAAGIFVSSCVLLLGATRLVDALNAVVPRSIVRGLQLGVGLKLTGSGLRMALTLKAPRAAAAAAVEAAAPAAAATTAAAASSAVAALRWRPALGADGLLLGALALAFLLVTTIARRSEEEPRDVDPLPPLPLRLRPPASWRARRRRRWQGADGAAALAATSSWSADGASSASGDAATEPSQPQPQPQQQQHPRAGKGDDDDDDREADGDAEAPGPAASSSAAAPPWPPPSPQQQPLSLPPPCIAADACCPQPAAPPAARLRVPSALVVVVVGVVLTVATAPSGALSGLRLGPSKPQVIVPSPADFLAGMTTAGGVAQLPLTTLNSVIAVTQLADALYGGARPQDRWRWRPSLVAASVGLMNLVGCFFGAMPACHGSGGLAAQHLYGARTGAAPVLLGVLKIALALLFGSSLFELLRLFPEPLLGAMLALSGVELACAARREAGPRGFSLAALTAAAILALDDAALGFAVGYGGWLAVVSYEAACGLAARGWVALKGAWSRRGRRAAARPGSASASPLVVGGGGGGEA